MNNFLSLMINMSFIYLLFFLCNCTCMLNKTCLCLCLCLWIEAQISRSSGRWCSLTWLFVVSRIGSRVGIKGGDLILKSRIMSCKYIQVYENSVPRQWPLLTAIREYGSTDWSQLPMGNVHCSAGDEPVTSRHITHNIFQSIFLNENVWWNVWISINISLKFAAEGQIDNIPS